MHTPLTPDDVRAIVREELGLDRPLPADVAADIAATKTQAAKVAAEKLEVDGSIAGHRIARSNTSEAGPLAVTVDWCACGAKGRVTVRDSRAGLLGGRCVAGDGRLDPQDLRLQDADGGYEARDNVVPAADGRVNHAGRGEPLIHLEREPDVRPLLHVNSSSVVPGAGHTRADHTVEAPGDTARVNSSPRRVVGTRAPIIPPYTLYALTVTPSRMGSPSIPAVDLIQTDIDGGHEERHRLHPSQARDLAAWLLDAADQAEAVAR